MSPMLQANTIWLYFVKACQNQIHLHEFCFVLHNICIINETVHKTFRVIHTIWLPAIFKLW